MALNNATSASVPSEKVVSATMQQGFQEILMDTATGFVIGGLAGIVLSRGGGSTAARKSLVGLCSGIGFGSSWTRTSMNIEDCISSHQLKK
jgi:H+/gluconate symporter-like permease